MPSLSGVSGLLKLALPLALGAALAGAIAWGASSSGGGTAPPSLQQTAATPTPFAEGSSAPLGQTRPPRFPSNHIPPDQAALDAVATEEGALQRAGLRCPPSHFLYESVLLGGSFCFPPAWILVFGDRPVLPPGQRPEGYASGLLLVKKDASGKELARVAIQLTYHPRSGSIDCPQPGQLQAGPLVGRVCFLERKVDDYNSVPAGSARIINVGLPHKLDLGSETWAAVEIADETPGQATVRFSRRDQQEGLGIIASIRFNP